MMMTTRNYEPLLPWILTHFVDYVRNVVNRRGVILKVVGRLLLGIGVSSSSSGGGNRTLHERIIVLSVTTAAAIIGGWDIVVVVEAGMAGIHLMKTITMTEQHPMIHEV
jgi:hypothetical protein